jgi:hypothetical protein
VQPNPKPQSNSKVFRANLNRCINLWAGKYWQRRWLTILIFSYIRQSLNSLPATIIWRSSSATSSAQDSTDASNCIFHESNSLVTSLNEENSKSHYVQLDCNTQFPKTHVRCANLWVNEIPTEVPGRPRIPIFSHLSSSTCSPATKIDSENSAASSTIFLRLIYQLLST